MSQPEDYRACEGIVDDRCDAMISTEGSHCWYVRDLQQWVADGLNVKHLQTQHQTRFNYRNCATGTAAVLHQAAMQLDALL